MARHVGDEALLSFFVKNFFPQCARGVEVLGSDFGKKGHGFVGELAVHLVPVDGALAETNGLDGREVIGARTLVVECHAPVALEVGGAVSGPGRIHGQLLVVGSDSVPVSVGVRE